MPLQLWRVRRSARNLEALDFRELMDGGIFSYEVKMIKPSRWIFEELLYRYGINREEAVFFDDNAANAEAACQVGLHGISLRVMKMPVRSWKACWR